MTHIFRHTSTFGTINGKQAYLNLVEGNRDRFWGYRFEIQDTLYDEIRAYMRYWFGQGNFRLEVGEWQYFAAGLIKEVVAYYDIGEIRQY